MVLFFRQIKTKFFQNYELSYPIFSENVKLMLILTFKVEKSKVTLKF